jgi:hypothetical protein
MRSFHTLLVLCALLLTAGCRTAVVAGPKRADTKTVVTVREVPRTQPSDKGLEIIDQR